MKYNRSLGWRSAAPYNLSYEVPFWLAALLLTGIVFAAYAHGPPWNRPDRSFDEFVTSATYRPFVYRVLVPLLSEAASRIVPLALPTYYTIFAGLSLFGFVVALRVLAQSFWQPSPLVDYVVFLAIPLITPFTLEYSHPYDLPILCLFTWGIICIVQRRWGAFLLCYTIACFNKETTLFLSLILVATHYPEVIRGTYNKLLCMQLSIYAIVRGSLVYIFRENPGATMDYHLTDHLIIYAANPGRTLIYLVGLVFVAVLVARQWHHKPAFLRRSLLVVLPPMVVLFALFGFPYELRVFYEIYSLVVLLCIPPGYMPLRSDRRQELSA
ncbi:MAG TPA: hypothetical protein VFS21_19925 [Roseiflexaceae bacterium]|nr:hypothetical protein [Roseiflexaceae bacterium]